VAQSSLRQSILDLLVESKLVDRARLEKDLKIYLHEKEAMDKKALEELFGERQEEGAEE